jgi:hypothetical protein
MTSPENRPETQGNMTEPTAPVAEPVYAPASERVPKTVPDYGDVVSRTDTGTAERQATASEPSFTRVPRPNGDTAEPAWDTSQDAWMTDSGGMQPKRFVWAPLIITGGIGIWLWMRWRRERNRPINRLRRQARQAAGQARQRAYALREQMPDLPEFPYEARRPAIGLGTAMLPLALLVWQRSQSHSRTEEASRQTQKAGKRAAEKISDSDWMARLQQLKDDWTARRVEIEKVKITRR